MARQAMASFAFMVDDERWNRAPQDQRQLFCGVRRIVVRRPKDGGSPRRVRGSRRRGSSTLVALVFLGLSVSIAAAQELEPRAYGNVPVGLNFLLLGYGYSGGDVATDPSLPLQNAEVDTHGAVLAYARTLDVWGMSGKVDFVLPYAFVDGTAELAGQAGERKVSGFGDPRLRFSVNFFGAPALSLAEFKNYEQDVVVGASFALWAPLGQYDSEKILNIGTNRWAFRPQLGVSKTWGPLTLELAPDITFYADNRDFLGARREQDPLISVQGHLIYHLRPGIWISLDGTYYTGGRTTINGVKGDDRQENTRLGATLALPVNRYHSIKLYYSSGVTARIGGDFDNVGIAWQYRFGAGL